MFTYYFLRALDRNDEKYFDAGQLFNDLKVPVANNSYQTPAYSPVRNTGDEGGQGNWEEAGLFHVKPVLGQGLAV